MIWKKKAKPDNQWKAFSLPQKTYKKQLPASQKVIEGVSDNAQVLFLEKMSAFLYKEC